MKSFTGKNFIVFLFFVLGILFFSFHSAEATTRYPVTGGGNWATAATWTTNPDGTSIASPSVPTALEDVVFNANSGSVTVNTTTCVAKSLDMTGSAGTLTISNNQKLTVSGNVTLASAKFSAGGTGANLTMNGTGTFTSASNTLGAVTFDGVSQTFTLGDNLTMSGNFTMGNGTPNFSTYTLSMTAASPTFAGNGKTYSGTLSYGGTGGTFTITGANTFHNLSYDGSAKTNQAMILSLGADQIIDSTGSLILRGGVDNRYRLLIKSNTVGTRRTVTLTSGATLSSPQRIDLWDIGFTDPIDLSAITGYSGNAGGNSSNITFTPARTLYWYTSTSGIKFYSGYDSTRPWWTTADHSSGQLLALDSPLIQDSVTFLAGSVVASTTIRMDQPMMGTDITSTGFTTSPYPTWYSMGISLYIGGSLQFGTWGYSNGVGTSSYNFIGRGTHTLTHGGMNSGFYGTHNFYNYNDGINYFGEMNLTDNYVMTSGGSFNFYNGTFTASNGSNITTGSYAINGATINMGSGTWKTISTSSTNPVFNYLSGTVNSETSTLEIGTDLTTAVARSILLTGLTMNNINISGKSTSFAQWNITDSFKVKGTFTIASPNRIRVTGGKTITLGLAATLNWQGTAGNLINFSVVSGTTAWRISKPAGAPVSVDYVDLSYSNALQENFFYAGTNSNGASGQNNTNWVWSAPPVSVSCLATSSGPWSTGGNWSGCSGVGGVPGAGDNITINAGVTITQDVDSGEMGTILINGTLDTSASNFALNAKRITISQSGILSANGSTITLSETSGAIALFAIDTDGGVFNRGTSTIVINSDASILATYGTLNLNNLTFSPLITSARTYTFGADAITVSGNLNILPNGGGTSNALTVNLGANNFSVVGAFNIGGTNSGTTIFDTFDTTASNYSISFPSVVIASGSTLNTRGSAVNITGSSGTLIDNVGTWTAPVSPNTVTLSGNGDALISTNTLAFQNLTISGTGTKSSNHELTLGGTFTQSAGSLSFPSSIMTFNIPNFQKWVKHPLNPLLRPGSTGAWDSSYIVDYNVIKEDDGTYKMWYVGSNGSANSIGLATSPDGITWTKYAGNPVLVQDQPYEAYLWEARVIKDEGIYKMWYQAYEVNTAYHANTNYATSPDGITWAKYAGNPVLVSTPGNWDQNYAGARDVIKVNGVYTMWYEGLTYDGGVAIATSPDGITWTKYAGNPIISSSSGEWDYNNVFPSTILENGIYKMFYTRNFGPPSLVGLATSTDTMNWTKDSENPIINLQGASGAWDSAAGELVDMMQPDDIGRLYGYYRANDQTNGNKRAMGLLTNFLVKTSSTVDSITVTVPDSFIDHSSGSAGYYFYRVEDPTQNSGWTHDNTWTDTGLSPNTAYTYYVKYRNTSGVGVAYNTTSSTYLLSNTPSSLTTTSSLNSITLSWLGNAESYYAENTTTNENSGWISGTSFISSGLNCGTTYSFRVKGKNISDVETDWVLLDANTNTCPRSAGRPPILPVSVASTGNVSTATTGNPTPSTPDTSSSNGGTVPFTFKKNLKVSQTHSDVKELQKFLNSKGYTIAKKGAGSIGKETNYFGPATKRALIKFQKENNIKPASGYFGPATRKVVNGMER